MKKYFRPYILLAVATAMASCADFLEIESPSTQVSSSAIFEDEATATSTLTGIYSEMSSSTGFASGGLSSITLLAGRSADDFTNYSQNASAEFSANELTGNNSYLKSYIWDEGYRYIYDVNAVIEGLARSTNLSQPVKDQLLGEAKFLRAFCYFYLTNFFNDVPLLTSTDYSINSIAPRSPAGEVYNLIVSDLQEAKTLLKEDYAASAGQKTRPNRYAATALLSRVYLYRQEWAKAETEASVLIDSEITLETDLNKVFLKNSSEAIWQLMPPKGTNNTKEGAAFILTTRPTEVSLSSELTSSFETGDARKDQWMGSIIVAGATFNFPLKYKVKTGTALTEYSMVFRLAEQYLIRAEARAKLTNLPGAISDVDMLRARASLPLYQDTNPAIGQANLLLAIEQERRIELFSEWGHRWLDLKRTDRTGILVSKDLASWQPADVLYPIPLQEIQNNNNLLPQNPGY